MEEIYIERKLAKTGGGVYLRIPKAIVEAHNIEGGEFVKAKIKIEKGDKPKETEIPKASEDEEKEMLEKLEKLREPVKGDDEEE